MEILIVLAIIGLVLSLGLPAIQTVTNQRINSTARKFTGMFQTIRNDAILLNLVHRLVINFEDNTFWVESQKKLELLSEGPGDPKKKDKETGSDSNFEIARKYSKKPVPMPDGVIFAGVLTERDGLIKQGIAHIHFFPNGFCDQAILYLAKSGADSVFYSMVLRPFAARVELVPGTAQGF